MWPWWLIFLFFVFFGYCFEALASKIEKVSDHLEELNRETLGLSDMLASINSHLLEIAYGKKNGNEEEYEG